ncbi:MAG: DNA polymerase III subunit beta [Synergistaceae bacterium]|jgi:DNA polymerase-3 subunit beta|nr:DNA polymerase III subunit beta [Synergistaceae bacterium]
MKIDIIRSEFMKWWQMAERSSSDRSTVAALGGILVSAENDRVYLQATDLKTSIRCVAGGIAVSEEGSAIFPVKLLGELFKKASVDTLKVEIKGNRGVLSMGRNRTRFTTWPVGDFPQLPKSEGAESLCVLTGGELLRVLAEGSIASSATDDFPKYLGACLLQVQGNLFQVVSTDGRRLSLSKCTCQGEQNSDMLLPLSALRELQRLLAAQSSDVPVRVLGDGSLAWFQMGDLEFSVRRVESSFPSYERVLNPGSTTTAILRRDALLSALERVDVIVRSYSRLVVMQFSPGGRVKMTGRAPELGTVVEYLDAKIDGESMRAGFNVGYLQDGLKSLGADDVCMNLNGDQGQMTLIRQGADDFLYMLMPMRVADEDLLEPEEEEEGEEAAADSTPPEEDEAPETLKEEIVIEAEAPRRSGKKEKGAKSEPAQAETAEPAETSEPEKMPETDA